jgi:hypothetical protein
VLGDDREQQIAVAADIERADDSDVTRHHGPSLISSWTAADATAALRPPIRGAAMPLGYPPGRLNPSQTAELLVTHGSQRQGMPPLLREALVSLGCMLALVCLLFPDVLLLGRTTTTSAWSPGVLGAPPHAGYDPETILERNPYLRDSRASANASETAAEFMAGLIDDPGRALWDPYRSLGSPVLATGDPQLTSPIRWPLAFTPTPLAWDVFALVRLIATGVLGHLLAWRLGCGRWSSVAASVVIAAGGFTALHDNSIHVDQLLALTLAMHAVLSFGRSRSAASVLATGITGAMVVVADNLQAGLIGLALLTGFALHVLRRAEVSRTRAAVLSLVPGALAVGLTAVVLLPMIELAGSPFNPGESLHLHMDDRGLGLAALSLRGVADLLVPYIGLGSSVRLDINVSFGVAVAFLAMLGALQPGPHRRFLAAATGLLLLKLFGAPVVNELGRLPVLTGVNFLLYTAAPLQLLVGLLVGTGVERATRDRPERWATAAMAGLLAVTTSALVIWRTPDAERAGLLAIHLLLLVAVGAVALARHRKVAWRPVALAVVVAAQVGLMWLPRLGAVVYDRPVERVLGLEVVDRVARSDPFTSPEFVAELQRVMAPGDRFVAQGGLIFPNSAGVFELEDLRGMSAFTSVRFHALLTTFIDHRDPIRFEGREWTDLFDDRAHPRLPEVLDLLGVEWIVSNIALPDATLAARYPELELAYASPLARIYHNPDALDRAFLVDDAVTVASLEAAMSAMAEPSVDLRRTAVVETDELPLFPAAEELGEVRTLELSAARLRFDVTAPATRLLVVGATHYPGWKAHVNGEPVEVFPAYGALRAVVVPSGESEVTFVFRPTSVLVGGAVTTATLLGLLLGVAAAARRRWHADDAGTSRRPVGADHVPA